MTIRPGHAILTHVVRPSPIQCAFAASATLVLCVTSCADNGATPLEGTWLGENVGFHLEDGEVSDWWLQKMYCDAQGSDSPSGASCLAFPESPFQATRVHGGRFTLQAGALTMSGKFTTDETVIGRWTVRDPDCCEASGEWSAELIEPLPESIIEDDTTPDDMVPTDPAQGNPAPTTSPPASVEEVCTRWTSDTQELSEGMWTGNTVSCQPGALNAVGKANTLKAVNLFRAVAGLKPFTTSDAYDDLAQACSLMMQANQTISHTPDTSWTCFSEQGAKGAGESNLATAPAVSAVFLYMGDIGNETTMGHRRWILQNGLGPIGIGSAPDFSCLHLLGSESVDQDVEWTAWPPAGAFPFEAVSTLAPVGWTFHAHTVDLTNAEVRVSRQGEELAITQWRLAGGYGGSEAIAFAPDGWSVSPGNYEVAITSTPSVSYVVNVVACGP